MLKKRVFRYTKPLKDLPVYRWAEPSPMKPFLKFRAVEKGFAERYETIKVSFYTLMVSYFSAKPFSTARSFNKGFGGEGSAHRYTGRSFKGFVYLKTRFLSISNSFDAFKILLNLFGGSVKNRLFLECSSPTHLVSLRPT